MAIVLHVCDGSDQGPNLFRVPLRLIFPLQRKDWYALYSLISFRRWGYISNFGRGWNWVGFMVLVAMGYSWFYLFVHLFNLVNPMYSQNCQRIFNHLHPTNLILVYPPLCDHSSSLLVLWLVLAAFVQTSLHFFSHFVFNLCQFCRFRNIFFPHLATFVFLVLLHFYLSSLQINHKHFFSIAQFYLVVYG